MTKIKRTAVALAGGLMMLGACKDSLSVGELNSVTDDLANSLNRTSVQLLVTGLLDRDRANLDVRYLVFVETMARDLYRLDPAESRFITEMVGAAADPSAFTGGGIWTQFFIAIRTANVILNGLPSASGLSDAEKRATAGVVRTFKALNYYRALEVRDSLGIPVDLNRGINEPLADIVCKPNVLAYIAALLDSANTDLQAGGGSFPFVLPSGFTSNGDFDTPATFATFNRGLKGKVELYRGLDHQRPDPAAYDRAIAAINASFADTVGTDTDEGVYYTFSSAPGEIVNPLDDVSIHLNPMAGDSIQAGDLRRAKITTCASGCRLHGVNTTYDFAYAVPTPENLVRPIANLKTAELILLRAQAYIEKNDFVSALRDINYIRRVDGGLGPVVCATKDACRSLVLYEKRYSLLGESAHRLVDLRAYGRLNATFLRKELPIDVFQSALPIPTSERNARSGNVTPVCT